MHEELFTMLHTVTQDRPKRIAVAAPRGHAKSTVVSLAYLLWSVLFDHERFALIISATKEQAVQLLKNIKDEIQTNERLLIDFPGVCHPPGSKATPKPWRDNSIALHNGVLIRALGAGQSIRGTKHGSHRPSLIIVDDLENQDQCESADQRYKLRDWFEKALLKAGDERTNVIVVGTILHYDSLLANLTHTKLARGKGAGWDSRIYRAIESFSDRPDLWELWESVRFGEKPFKGDNIGPEGAKMFFDYYRNQMLEGTRVLWPQREDYLQLMQLRADESRASFQSEKQNEPLDPEQCLFSEDSFKYWDDEYADATELLTALKGHCRIYGACDPSLGRRGNRGDYTAIVTVVKDTRSKRIYVVHADLARRKPEKTIEKILSLATTFEYDKFLIEANQFQEVLANQLQDRARAMNVRLYPEKVDHTSHKQTRIESLEPVISSGQLRFNRSHQLLLEQLRQFPLGAHDDGPDALEMAVYRALKPPSKIIRQWF